MKYIKNCIYNKLQITNYDRKKYYWIFKWCDIKQYYANESIQNIEGKSNFPFDVLKLYGLCEYQILSQV